VRRKKKNLRHSLLTTRPPVIGETKDAPHPSMPTYQGIHPCLSLSTTIQMDGHVLFDGERPQLPIVQHNKTGGEEKEAALQC
jgi:hypothetical protein